MEKDLQENFIFLLVPFYKRKCVRPVCSKGPQKKMKHGLIVVIQLTSFPWQFQGSTERIVLLHPPSKLLKKFGKTSHATFTQIDVENIANECFLSEMDFKCG